MIADDFSVVLHRQGAFTQGDDWEDRGTAKAAEAPEGPTEWVFRAGTCVCAAVHNRDRLEFQLYAW